MFEISRISSSKNCNPLNKSLGNLLRRLIKFTSSMYSVSSELNNTPWGFGSDWIPLTKASNAYLDLKSTLNEIL